MFWGEFWVRAGSGAELSAMGGIRKLSATHPLQLERQTCCSMSANSCYNLPTGKLVILLVFPCFLFSRELFLNTGRLNIGPFLEVLSAWSTLWNQCEQTVQHPNLPLFSPLFCTVQSVNTAQKLSDEDPVGIRIDYFFNCLPVGMDCLFLQRGQMIFITNEPKPWGRTCITFPWQRWQEWKILIRV